MGRFWKIFGQKYLKFYLSRGHFYKKIWNIVFRRVNACLQARGLARGTAIRAFTQLKTEKREQWGRERERGEHQNQRRALQCATIFYYPSKVAKEWRNIPMWMGLTRKCSSQAYTTRTAAHLRRSKTPRFTFLYTSVLESLYTDVTKGMEWIWESPLCPYVRVRNIFCQPQV